MAASFAISDDMQRRTRKERGFDKAEADLPVFTKTTVKPRSSTLSANGKLGDILSYLGSRNPLPRQVAADDTVWMLDNTAYKNPQSGQWEAEFVTAVLEQEPSCKVVDAVSSIARKLDLGENDASYATIEERIQPFIQDIRPGTQVKALQAGSNLLKLGPGGRNGISSDVKPAEKSGDHPNIAPSFAQVPDGANGVLMMKTFFAEPEGWSVISGESDRSQATLPCWTKY